MRRFVRLTLLAAAIATFYLPAASPAEAAGCAFLGSAARLCRPSLNPEPATFAPPEVPANTLYGRRTYAWLEDNANVYPAPTRAVAPKRNVGVGYLYVTVNGSLVNEAGETWFEINGGEYVHGDDVHLVKASGFQGVAVQRQPERPFAWVVQNVVPSREPDGAPDPAFGELSRFTFVEIYGAIRGAEGWIWYEIGAGRWVKQIYFSVLDVNSRPAGVGPGDYWVEVDLYEQTFAAYQGDRMVYATLISSGLNRWPTREGLFQVWSRLRQYKMSGAEGQVDYYYLEDVPYIMYFDSAKGIGLHGTYWHSRFGYKHSHGCVNMPILDAEWTYNWSAGAPNDLWVWVHTSNPQSHLALGGGS